MLTVFALLLFAASPDTATAPAPAEATAKPVKPKKICRAGAETGTRMTSKICKTQAEWDAMQGADSTKVDRDRGV